MKVVLLNNNHPYYKLDSTSSLTVGRIYDVIYNSVPVGIIGDHYLIKNDYGVEAYFKRSFFKLLSEVRGDKISLLLNENSSVDEI